MVDPIVQIYLYRRVCFEFLTENRSFDTCFLPKLWWIRFRFLFKAANIELSSKRDEYENFREKALKFQQKLPKGGGIASSASDEPQYARLEERWKDVENQFDTFKREHEIGESQEELKAFYDTVSALENMLAAVDKKLTTVRELRQSDYDNFSSQVDLLQVNNKWCDSFFYSRFRRIYFFFL